MGWPFGDKVVLNLNPDMERYIHATALLRRLYRMAEGEPFNDFSSRVTQAIDDDCPWLMAEWRRENTE